MVNPLTNYGFPYRKPQPITIEPEELDMRSIAEKSAQLRTDAMSMCTKRRNDLIEQRDGIIAEIEELDAEIAALERAESAGAK